MLSLISKYCKNDRLVFNFIFCFLNTFKLDLKAFSHHQLPDGNPANETYLFFQMVSLFF